MSIAKNYIFNLIYQIVTLIIPIITIPYISRVLGSNGIGINAYTYSIIQYFILLGTVGISLYGNRQIAYVRDNKVELSRTFWGIFTLRIITMVIAILCFLIFLVFVKDNQKFYIIQSIFIFAAAVDISWLFMGLEDFKKTVIRNLIVRIVGVLCIYLFVKTSTDLWKYIFILSTSQLLGNLSLWIYLPKTVQRIKLKWNDIKKHLMPSIYLFIPQIAVQIYVILNKTMLGILSNTVQVGLFDNADKIIKIVLSIVTAMGIVMLPRIANIFAKGKMDEVRHYLYNSFDFASYLAFPLMFGIASISLEFAPWFFGAEFTGSGILILILSPIILFIAWSNVLGTQYLMPVGKIKGYTLSVVIGAIVNFTLNLLLIGRYQAGGTAIATLIGEFTVTAVQFYLVRRDLELKKLFKSTWKYLTSGILMYIITQIVGIISNGGFKTLTIQVIIGAISYFSLLFLLRSELNEKLFSVVFKRILRKRH